MRALDAIVRHGSHMVTNAEFGCADGIHAGWRIVDAESKNDAARLVPPQFREDAEVVQLRTWNKEEIQATIKKLEG